jgi:crotonobetainyl-CoA:carnitine CoA-transferase CaiB-like acyl-CoA transferase
MAKGLLGGGNIAKEGKMIKGALEGVKVLDFTIQAAGPHGVRQLTDWGATVIKVESIARPDTFRQGAPMKADIPGVDRSLKFLAQNAGKMSMGLNLKYPQGMEIAKRLVKWTDVMYQNFAGGVIKRMGLGYDVVKEINPGIIMVSSSVFGDKSVDKPAYKINRGGAPTAEAMSGFFHFTGWPDEEVTRGGKNVWPGDWMAPTFGGSAVLAALDYRRRTGKGQHIDLSQLEAMVHLMRSSFLNYQFNEGEQNRLGNRHHSASPHGAFLCQDEEYCAIAVFTQEQWQALCDTIGNPAWYQEERFATPQARKANEDELEARIETWTRTLTAREVMEKLQRVKVPAGVVQTIEDIMDKDPQIKAMGTFAKLEHPVMGQASHLALPYKLSKTPGELRTAPLLGQHTKYICLEILKMSREEYETLKGEGVLEEATMEAMASR